MSLQINLALAEMAVKYAEQHLRGKASNKPEDIVHTLQRRLNERYPDDPERVTDELANQFNVGLKCAEIYQNRVSKIADERERRRRAGNRLSSAAIIASGIGNCFEHSVLACHFLNTKGHQSYMADTDEDTDHVFVLLGLPPGLGGQTVTIRPNARPGAPLDAADAVVCDPWYHEWFGIQQFWPTKMNRILNTTNKRQGPLPATVPLTLTDGLLVT